MVQGLIFTIKAGSLELLDRNIRKFKDLYEGSEVVRIFPHGGLFVAEIRKGRDKRTDLNDFRGEDGG